MAEKLQDNARLKINLGMFQPAKGFFMLLIIQCHNFGILGKHPHFSVQTLQTNPVLGLALFILDFFFSNTLIPCFFMICGYSIRRRPLRYLIKGTPLYLLKAYLITSVICICLNTLKAIVRGYDVSEYFITECLSFILMPQLKMEFLGHTAYGIGAIWFVYVLAIDSILLNQILALKSRWSQAAVCVLLAVIGMALRQYNVPFFILQSCICCSFMYIGHLISQYKLLTKKIPLVFVVFPLLFWVFLFVRCNFYVDIYANFYSDGMVDLIAIWLLGYHMLYAAAYLGQRSGKLIDFLSWMGQYSFVLCCIHHVENRVLLWKEAVAFVTQNLTIQFFAALILRICLCLALTYAFVQFEKKKRLCT